MASGKSRVLAGVALLLALLLALLALAYTAKIEFGPLRGKPLQVDELFFSACAARAAAIHQTPNVGCHDNKGPVIYSLHQWVLRHAQPYDIDLIKRWAFGAVLLLSAAAALLALRIGGLVAAVTAPTLLLQALVINADLLALKTETVGMLLVCAALGSLLTTEARPSSGRWLLAGLLLGVATLTKQTYMLMAAALLAWQVVLTPGGWRERLRGLVGPALLLLGGLALPLLLCLLIFWSQGRADDFLASMFIYPAVYGRGPPTDPERLFLRVSTLLDKTVGLRGLFIVVALLALMRSLPLPVQRLQSMRADARQRGRLLIAIAGTILLAIMFVSPILSPYHPIPLWTMLAVLAAGLVDDLWRQTADRAPQRWALVLVLGFSSLLTLNTVYRHNAGRETLPLTAGAAQPSVAGARPGQYAYLLGMPWPDFYVVNGLVPASDVMFPWALPGMPGFWGYTPPSAESRRGRALAALQASNLRKLYDDFKATPPVLIAVMTEFARLPNSPRVADVPGFDEYLRSHCQPQPQSLQDTENKAVLLFRCNQE